MVLCFRLFRGTREQKTKTKKKQYIYILYYIILWKDCIRENRDFPNPDALRSPSDPSQVHGHEESQLRKRGFGTVPFIGLRDLGFRV